MCYKENCSVVFTLYWDGMVEQQLVVVLDSFKILFDLSLMLLWIRNTV